MKKEYLVENTLLENACGDIANKIFDILKEYELTVKEAHILLKECADFVGRAPLTDFPTKDGNVPDWFKTSLCKIID